MAILGMDGFDHYNTAENVTLMNSVENYALLSTAQGISASNTRFGYGKCYYSRWAGNGLDISVTGITDTMYVSFALKVSNDFALEREILSFWRDSGTDDHVRLRVKTDATLQMQHGGTGAALGTSTSTLSLDTWYWVEVKVKISDTVGTVEVRVNGTATGWISASALDTRNAGTDTSISKFRLSSSNGDYTYFDDLVWQDDNGAFLGDSRINTFMPTAENSIQWTPSTGTDNSALVDEIPANDDTDYVSSATVNDLDLYDVDALGVDDTIHAVCIHTRAKKTDTGSRDIESRTKSSTNEQGGTDRQLTTSYVSYVDVYETYNGSSAWTKTLFDAAQFGVKVTV